MRDLISGEAELGDEEDDESFDEQAGRERRKRPAAHVDDSSEEEEDDDDEEEARKVTRGAFDSRYGCRLTLSTVLRSARASLSMRTKKRKKLSPMSKADRLRESESIGTARRKRHSMKKI